MTGSGRRKDWEITGIVQGVSFQSDENVLTLGVIIMQHAESMKNHWTVYIINVCKNCISIHFINKTKIFALKQTMALCFLPSPHSYRKTDRWSEVELLFTDLLSQAHNSIQVSFMDFTNPLTWVIFPASHGLNWIKAESWIWRQGFKSKHSDVGGRCPKWQATCLPLGGNVKGEEDTKGAERTETHKWKLNAWNWSCYGK